MKIPALPGSAIGVVLIHRVLGLFCPPWVAAIASVNRLRRVRRAQERIPDTDRRNGSTNSAPQLAYHSSEHSRGAGRILRRAACFCLLVGAVTACTTPSYRGAVTEFSSASKNAEEALVALDAHVTDAYFDVLRREIAAGKRLVQVKSGNCELTSERCRLVAVTPNGDRELFPPEPLLDNMIVLMRAMMDYAESLTAIVEAETAGEVATAANAT